MLLSSPYWLATRGHSGLKVSCRNNLALDEEALALSIECDNTTAKRDLVSIKVQLEASL